MGKLPFEKIEKQVFEVFESKINQYTPELKDLLVGGIVIIDKPAGPTSHQISDQVKKILNLPKAGHSGTLDPNVTGILPIAFDKGTKIIQALLNAGKEYICIMHIHGDFPEKKIRLAMDLFIGTIKQLPPVKSAVKRAERLRTIYYLEILEIKGRDVLFRVGCQAGTYIRKLCFDMGEKLGCGAHMAELRRTKAGPFNESNLVTLHDLTDAYYHYKNGNEYPLKKILLPIESALKHLPKIWIKDEFVNKIAHGQPIKTDSVIKLEFPIKENQMVAVLDSENKLVLLGTSLISSSTFNSSNNISVVKTLRVFKID